MPDTLLTFGWTGLLLALWVALCVGSFLNVVIYRLPVMLNRQWQADARAFLDQEPAPAGFTAIQECTAKIDFQRPVRAE